MARGHVYSNVYAYFLLLKTSRIIILSIYSLRGKDWLVFSLLTQSFSETSLLPSSSGVIQFYMYNVSISVFELFSENN